MDGLPGVTVITGRRAGWCSKVRRCTSDFSNNIFDTINYAADNGIVWVNSAGNYGKQNWVGQPEIDANGFMYFTTATAFNLVFLDAGQGIDIIVRWDDRWGEQAETWMCAFLTSSTFLTMLCSDDPQMGRKGITLLSI